MYIRLTHTTTTRHLRAADNVAPAASQHPRAGTRPQLRTDLQESGTLAALMHLGIWQTPHSKGPSSPYRNTVE